MSGGSAHPQVPIESFSFRLACYEQFGWTPEEVKDLPELEAERLAIYFEETGAYQHKRMKEAERQSPTQANERVVLEIGDDEDEE